MNDIEIEINEFKSKFEKIENSNITIEHINENSRDLKDALKVIALIKGSADLMKIDKELIEVINNIEKLKTMFNELVNSLKKVEKESEEYNAFMSILCAIDFQIKYLEC